MAEQKTPQGETIPVPKRGDVFRDLRKVAKGRRSDSDDGVGGSEQKQREQGGA